MELCNLAKAGIEVKRQVPLSRYSFTETGGPAEYLAFPRDQTELEKLVNAAQSAQIPLTVIGNASNLIIRDGGVSGLVLILTKMKQIKVKNNTVTAQAGARIIDTAFTAARHGLSGLEFAA
ncbi:FAD-binding protein, partial [Lactobacillus sp. XV13L]|nr:FAD-binding protein [Lactobacillus sp. XV13L]